MKKEKVIQILRKSALNYHKNLANKNFMILYENNNKIEYIETKFLPNNFLHLTGIELSSKISAVLFYKKCLNGKLSLKEIQLKKDGTTALKLYILEMITNICITAKMMGEYNNSRKNLYTEIIMGTSYISLGLIKKTENYFIPNTALKENVKSITSHSNRIIAIFSKKLKEKLYNEIYFFKYISIKDEETLQKLDESIKEKLR